MEPKMELRQVRDFGQLVNGTFVFAKQNLKPLLKALVIICGFFLVASAAAGIVYTMKIQGALAGDEMTNPSNMFGWEYALNILFMVLFYTSVALTVFCYIHLYVQKGNEAPDVEEVWESVKYYFLRVLGSGLLLTILTMVGFVFCFGPGIYLWPVTSIIMAVMVFENGTLGYSFDRGFKLIKGKWWTTFGAMFIVLIVLLAISMAILLPVSFLTAGTLFFTKARELSTPILLLNVILQSVAQIFYFLPYIVVSLAYFSLIEQKEGTGLMDRVGMIGKNNTDNDLPEEQY